MAEIRSDYVPGTGRRNVDSNSVVDVTGYAQAQVSKHACQSYSLIAARESLSQTTSIEWACVLVDECLKGRIDSQRPLCFARNIYAA